MLKSGFCRQSLLDSMEFRDWIAALGEHHHYHRKLWEWCFICQALGERDMLREGRAGLGCGVGVEPLVALFAGAGVRIVATDLCDGWYAKHKVPSNDRRLCPPDQFDRLATFRAMDMNWIHADLGGCFDFVWSSCALDHLGSTRLAKRFIYRSMEVLRPGGVAVHTTEAAIHHEYMDTMGGTVYLLRQDLEEIGAWMRERGYGHDLDWDEGDGEADRHVSRDNELPHLKLGDPDRPFTSVGLIFEKPLTTDERGDP